MDEQAKAHIQSAIESAAAEGEVVDGLQIGREAAAAAIAAYMENGEPQPALDTGTTPDADRRTIPPGARF